MKNNLLPDNNNPVPDDQGGKRKQEASSDQARQELHFLQELALSSIGEKIIFFDSERIIHWANQAACDFYQLPLEKMVGKTCSELLGLDAGECGNCPVRKALATNEFCQDVRSFPGGTTLLIKAYPTRSSGGLSGVVEVTLDITERVRVESALIKEKNQSLAASEAKSLFVANVSHEIRTLMNVILGMADLVYESTEKEEHRDYLCMIRESATFLLSLVNDILDLTKIEAGRLELAQNPFDLHRVADKTVSSFALQAQNKGLKLTYAIDSNVPKIVAGDAARLQQVLMNLIGNGIKFTEQGEVSVNIQLAEAGDNEGGVSVQETAEAAQVLFSISDTGIGIPPGDVDRVFQDFTQSNTYRTKTEDEGTGLGLHISKILVELMGGSIGVRSVENRGSTFYFTIPFILPRGDGEKLNGLDTTEPGKVPVKRPQGWEEKGLKILLVEDKPMNRRLATVLLEKLGHQVITAKNGREAFDLFKTQPFDAILMDIHMPVINGLEATERIRIAEKETGRYTPIIAMTASATKTDREICLKAGMDEYISKPFVTEELDKALYKVKQKMLE